MGKFILKSISYIFHPLLIPTFGLLVIFNSGTYHSYLSFDVKKVILSVYVISTVLLPLSVFPFLYYQKIVRNWTMAGNREKVLPILIVSGFHFFAWYMIGRYPIPPLYKTFLLYSSVDAFLLALISSKVSISPHMAGIGGLIGFTLALAFSNLLDLHFLLMLMFLVAGFVATSRLGLQRNSALSVYGSFLLGLIIMFVPFYFL